MKVTVQTEFYTKEQIRNNRDKLFVFGDNLARKGHGGQAAACRDEPNTLGIVTKWDEKRNPGSYMYDSTLEFNKRQITEDFNKLLQIYSENNGSGYSEIIIPAAGLGTGLANLATNAPETLEFLNGVLDYFINLADIDERNQELKNLAKKLWPKSYYNYVR